VEAIPIAGVGKIKVIAIDFRSSPTAHFPAATEDVAAVYRELLKEYQPGNIGIYGCSTGATLTASAVAWFQKVKLPRPGAIGLLCEGAVKDDNLDGDGWYLAHALMATGAIPAPGKTDQVTNPEPYMSGASATDPLVAPVVSLQVLGQFPPTILISGTRDMGLSAVLYTNRRLVMAGIPTSLNVWDGMWHNFHFDVDLPESKEVYTIMTKFFDQHLGH
jgi:acetyl esterase/lipase